MMLIRTSTETWNAEYTVQGNRDAQIVRIKSRSSITVVIAKIMENLPLVGNAIQSPYVAMSQNFMSQTNRLWMEIYQIVKENCATEYNGATPQDDVMERLLLARKGN